MTTIKEAAEEVKDNFKAMRHAINSVGVSVSEASKAFKDLGRVSAYVECDNFGWRFTEQEGKTLAVSPSGNGYLLDGDMFDASLHIMQNNIEDAETKRKAYWQDIADWKRAQEKKGLSWVMPANVIKDFNEKHGVVK